MLPNQKKDCNKKKITKIFQLRIVYTVNNNFFIQNSKNRFIMLKIFIDFFLFNFSKKLIRPFKALKRAKLIRLYLRTFSDQLDKNNIFRLNLNKK